MLSNVFKLMNPTIEQYKKIRLVCKCWLDVTFDEWRQKAPVRITEEKEVFVDKSPGGISAGEFLKRFEDPDDPYQLASAPFSTYIFTDLTINMSLADQEGSACCRFWDKVGPCFENLHLFKCAFPLHQYMAFEQLLLEKVPNLRKLSMTDCQKVRIPAATSSSIFANREAIIERVKKMKEKQLSVHTNLKSLTICGEMPVKLKRLISKVPNIEELRIRRIRDDMDALESHFSEDDDGELLDVLVMIRNQRIQSNHTKYPLKSLDLMYSRILYNPVSFPRLLDNVKFPLTTLSVEINPQQSANRQQLKPLMEIHAGTLKNLTVFCPPFHHTRYHDTFPFAVNMEQLEHLVILGNVTRDLKFLKFMPNLKRVEIRPRCEPISKVILSLKNGTLENTRYSPYLLPCADDIVERTFENGEADVFPSTSLQSLEIDYEFKTESLRRLKELMPNLSSLKSIFNRQTLPIVCELWPDINFIKAGYGSNIDDSSITGWKYQQGERTTTTGKHCLAKLTGKFGFGRFSFRFKINQLNLNVEFCSMVSDLRGFQLETLCGQAHLTSLSLPDGFLTMPRLVQVDITVSPKV